MRIADRHIVSELLLFFGVSTLAVLTLLVGVALLFQQASIATLPYSIPYYLTLTLPVAVALAASLSVNRMARDNELTVLRGTGTPLFRAFLPILIVGFAVSVLDYILFDRVLPYALQQQVAKYGQVPETVSPGATFAVDKYTVSYASSQKLSPAKRRLSRLVIVETPENGAPPPQITTATTADYENTVWKMQGVIIHYYDAKGVLLREEQKPTATFNLPVDFSNLYQRADSAQAEYTFVELMARSKEAARFGNHQDAVAYEVDGWTKLALPGMAFVFTLFATPLALMFARTGSFSGVMLAIGAVFVAWNTLLLMQYVGYGDYLPPAVAAWSTDILFGLPGIFLLWRADR